MLHRTVPESSQATYSPFTTVDFLIDARGRKLMKNSIRVEGTINATKDGTANVDFDSNVKVDNCVGAHAFFDSWTCETEQKGVQETLMNYPRAVAMQARSTLSQDDMLDSALLAECRGPAEINGNYVLQPVADNSFASAGGSTFIATDNVQPTFSLKPMIMWNRSGGGEYSFDKNGWIRISCILAPNVAAMFGGAGTQSYTLSDLACRFQTVPDDGIVAPMLMKSYVNVVSSVQSTATSISARVPSQSVNGVAISFVDQATTRSALLNSYALETLQLFSGIEFLFSNTAQNFLTYTVNDQSEAIAMGLAALDHDGHSRVSSKTLKANQGYLLGINFGEYVDLSVQKFTVNLSSDYALITGNPMDCHLYFQTLILSLIHI